MTDKPKEIVINQMAEFSIPVFSDDAEYVYLMPTESIRIPLELGADVTFTLRVAEITKKESL